MLALTSLCLPMLLKCRRLFVFLTISAFILITLHQSDMHKHYWVVFLSSLVLILLLFTHSYVYRKNVCEECFKVHTHVYVRLYFKIFLQFFLVSLFVYVFKYLPWLLLLVLLSHIGFCRFYFPFIVCIVLLLLLFLFSLICLRILCFLACLLFVVRV